MKLKIAALLLAGALPSLAAAANPLYPDVSRASADINAALKQAAQSKKRVLVDFGGNWCPDCKVLDINLRKPENTALLQDKFILVHVNVGEKGIDTNLDIGDRYGVPLKKGVPALVVLDSAGKVVHAQKNGEFESMRKLDPKAVNDFLVKWSP
ncbi:MAG: thioredoxin family protein [Usitatibacter sp.]